MCICQYAFTAMYVYACVYMSMCRCLQAHVSLTCVCLCVGVCLQARVSLTF